MSAARYLGAGLRLLAWFLLAQTAGIVGQALIIGLSSALDGYGFEAPTRQTLLTFGNAVVLALIGVFLLRQWRWLARRLWPRAMPGLLRRGPARAALLGGLAAIAIGYTLSALGQRTVVKTPSIDFPAENKALVYLLATYGVMGAASLRAALLGVRSGSGTTEARTPMTPRALELAGRFAIGVWILASVAVGIAQVLTVAFRDDEFFGVYVWVFAALVGLYGAVGYLYVRAGLAQRRVHRPPLRLACAAIGIAMILRLALPGATHLAEALHGSVRAGWITQHDQVHWTIFNMIHGALGGPAVLVGVGLGLGLIIYGRLGRGAEHLPKVFE